jgi:hypothetical protein
VTIYGLVKAQKKIIEETIDYSVADSSTLVLKINSLAYSDNFTKTLFLDFETNSKLQTIYDRLKERLTAYRQYDLHPHLSLIYKRNMAVIEKEKFIKAYSMKKEISFDRVALITAAKPIEIEEDVKQFQPFYVKEF